MKSICLFMLSLVLAMPVWAQTEHPALGTKVSSDDGSFTITLLSRKQNYSYAESATLDKDIHSPKSVNIHPNGEKFYVNSLEGGKTVVYATGTNEKLKVIEHQFTEADSLLWSEPSGLYPFTHYKKNLNTFRGKPVESAFSHNGRYLWVPYYRRSYDINAQDPSAVAVIDTQTDSIIKLMETGPLPKMVAVSGDNHHVAITHWGNNTVGIINIVSDSPDDWFYEDCVTVQKKLTLNFSLNASVNRDMNSGLCLRGTVFTPDGRYLLVGCMGGNGGIAVIDLIDFSYKGHVYGMKTNLRHLVIRNGYLYLSINKEGYIQRIPLETFYEAVDQMENQRVTLGDWENCKVAAGARTIDITPDGRYVVAACNFSSRLVVVDTESFQEIARIKADSYPVGLDISKDGKYVYTTSQGRDGAGGNCVDIYQMEY
jgi:DNA-binding beta-propeller fold protein YncE